MPGDHSEDGADALPDTAAYAIDPDCSREEFLAVAKVYARDVVDAAGLTVTVSNLDWEISMRAKRRAGAVKYRDGDPETVVLTWEHFANSGWERMAGTVRHELVHVHLLNEGYGSGHGERFRRLAERIEAPVHCERFSDPKYWVECEDCDTRLARYRRSKLVENPGQYRCGDCGGAFRVRAND